MYNLRISASRLNNISRKLLKEMAPQVGLEPATLRLRAGGIYSRIAALSPSPRGRVSLTPLLWRSWQSILRMNAQVC